MRGYFLLRRGTLLFCYRSVKSRRRFSRLSECDFERHLDVSEFSVVSIWVFPASVARVSCTQEKIIKGGLYVW